VAAINPEFLNIFRKSHSTAENHPILFKVKKLAEGHIGIKIFNEMVVSSDDNTDPGPEPLAGLCHGVPLCIGAPPQRPHLLEQVLDLVVRLYIDL
jgi:hypothetical protein